MIATSTRASRPFTPLLAILAAVMVLGGIAAAETARLTPATVKQFVASYPAMKTVVSRQAVARGAKIGSGKEALAAVIEAATDKEIKAEIDAAAGQYGFRDAKEWFGVARSVASAYAYLKLDADDVKKQRKIEKAIAKIEDNGFLSEKAKRKLVEALRDNAGVMIEAPPRENVDAVRPVLATIDAMVK